MIKYTTGDILSDRADAIVNTVNCVGVMGRGIALQFKKAWPKNFEAYAAACKQDEVRPGRMFVYETGRLSPPRFIINFPTKRHWRGKSRLEDIESGLEDLRRVIAELGIDSIAIPPLGSGLGGLDWPEVRSHIEALLGDLEVEIRIYEPNGAPQSENMSHVRKVPNMTPGRAALVALTRRYLGGLLDPSVSLLEVHKLMYFMQEAGEPLRLNYKKALYGPYAENLRHVLNEIEGHFVSGYADGGDAPDKPLKLVPGAVDEAEGFLQAHSGTKERFERVTKLVEGFESPYGMELLSTVHWVLKHDDGPTSMPDLITRVYAWGERKKRFTPRQIELAARALARHGWVESMPDEDAA